MATTLTKPFKPSRGAIRVLCLVGLAAILLIAIQNLVTTVEALNPPFAFERDFVQVYLLARAVPDRANILLPIPELSEQYLGTRATAFPYPIPHPPTAGLIVAPLALVDYATASRVWLVTQILCLYLAIALIARGVGFLLPARWLAGLAVLCLAWSPVNTDIFWGNYSLILLAILSGVWLSTLRGQPTIAGALLGISLAIKPLAWPVLLFFALRRQWRFIGSAAASGGLAVVITGLLVGFPSLIAYVTVVLPAVTVIYRASWGNISLAADAWKVFDGATNPAGPVGALQVGLPLLSSPAAAQAMAIALPTLATGSCLWVARRWARLDWGVALLMCLTVVVNPIAWDNYEALLLIPIAVVVGWLHAHPSATGPISAFVAIGILLIVPWWIWATVATFLAGGHGGQATPIPGLPALLLTGASFTVASLMALVATLGGRNESAS